jgi:hypothetical protein
VKSSHSLEKIAQWQKLKTLVLDSVSSPITKRVYNMAHDEFMDWVPAGAAGWCLPEWFVFALGQPLPKDPTRPITSFKTAWSKVRQQAGVKGRWHDNLNTLQFLSAAHACNYS